MSRRILIFVPGIMGTEILDKDVAVWPPQVGDVLHQDKMLARVASARRHGEPIRSAYCRAVYAQVWQALAALQRAHDDVLYFPMGYDWRLDISDAAARLGEDIQRQVRGSDQKNLQIVIVAHSMGGLVVRTLLESRFLRPRWANAVRAVIFLGTPHNGAPRAAAAALGLVSAQGIRAKTLRKSVEQGHFRSFLGLMPPETAPIVQVWEQTAFTRWESSAKICGELGVDPKKAFKHWTILQEGGRHRPNGCSYFCVGNGNIQTISSLAWQSENWRVLERLRAGDDTVPTVSAFLPSAMNYAVPGNHLKICDSPVVSQLVTMAFGLPATFEPFSGHADRATISASPEDVEEGEAVDVHLWSDGLNDVTVEIARGDTVEMSVCVTDAEHVAWKFVPRARGEHVARVVQDGVVLDQDPFIVHEV